MKLELVFLDENPDGSANMTIKYDKEAHGLLIQKAIETILLEYIEMSKNEKKCSDNGV
jgi:hypothetical protein